MIEGLVIGLEEELVVAPVALVVVVLMVALVVDEELVVTDGTRPTTSNWRDSSGVPGFVGVAFADTELSTFEADDDRDAEAAMDGGGMVVVDGEGVVETETDAAAWAGVTGRLDVPVVVTVDTTVVVIVVAKIAGAMLALEVLGIFGDDAGTSRAPATYTSVTF